MRKTLFLAITIFAMVSSLSAQSHFLRGDANNDGAVNIGDATFILGNLFSAGPTPQCRDAADVNDDGALNIADAVNLLGFLFVSGAPPAAPFPTFEGDPSADALDCKGTLTVHSGTITVNETWANTETHVLDGQVTIAAGATVTIPAGTTILGDSATQGFLVVDRGGRLVANGTSVSPVVFTSDQPVGSRSTGDWGGIIMLGRGANNIPGGIGMAEGLSIGGEFGGDPFDTTEDSGSLRFVRIEFGGTEISPNNEINALSMFGINESTTMEYIQTKYNLDDGFEWFGGNASLKYAMATGAGDDSFDFSFGWQGQGQYWVIQHNDIFAETDKPDNGFEVDNQEDALLYTATPRTDGRIANVTLVGDTTASDTDLAFQWRRGCASSVINWIAAGWQDAILDVDNDETTTVFDGRQLCMEFGVYSLDAGGELVNTEADTTDAFGLDLLTFICANPTNGTANNEELTDPLVDAFNIASPNFRPVAGVPAGTDANAYFGSSFFDAVDFRGAVAPTGTDWTQAPWISYLEN